MSDTLTVVGFDYETHLIAHKETAPRAVCLSTWGSDTVPGLVVRGEGLAEVQNTIFGGSGDDVLWVAHNLSFELKVTLKDRPDLAAQIFDAALDGRVHCTLIREKLLNLVATGDPKFSGGDEGFIKADYHLAGLVLRYFGEDISASKNDPDAWRLNYDKLDGMPLVDWPEDAKLYAISDSMWAVRIWQEQEKARQMLLELTGHDPFEQLPLRIAADFCLNLMSGRGVRVDAEARASIVKYLKKELSPDRLQLLIENNILVPAEPPRPYANGAKNEDGTPKMTAEKSESIRRKVLTAYVERLAKERPDEFELSFTAPSTKFPEGNVSVDALWLEQFADKDPVLSQYAHRQSLQKLVSTELPRMCHRDEHGNPTEVADVIHPMFDVLKATGRTSSFGTDNIPSFNCQNVLPMARGCFVPSDGYVLCSIDYGQMELVTLAQTCLNLFGESVLADKINAGYDVHAYLGACIACNVWPEFAEACSDVQSYDELYESFIELKGDPEYGDKFKHFRTLAKPTGLGYPGGLGPDTFIQYAKSTFKLDIDRDTAVMLRDVWHQVYPEMRRYFNHINKECVDPRHSKDRTKYHYSAPLGFYRPNADYCAAANGEGLQSPSAGGALCGLINVEWSVSVPGLDPLLSRTEEGYYPVRPLMFIHDEIVCEIREDELLHDRAMRIADIMVESFSLVAPDVKIKAEPVCMRRWTKGLDPEYDDQGRLMICNPKLEID